MGVRVCSYNIEWFNHLFNTDNSLKSGTQEQKRLKAVKNVLTRIDPDFLGIVEAPNSSADGTQSTVVKLENFARFAGLRISKALVGIISGGTQEIAAMYDPARLTVTHAPGGRASSKGNPPFDAVFYYDTDNDGIDEVYKHYRPPLEARVKVVPTGAEFYVIIAHAKSKGIFDSMDMMHWQRESTRSRLKLYAECRWIRRRVDEWLDKGRHVTVMGDFNDGPGMDYYEARYGRSAVEIVMGDIFEPDKILRNYCGMPEWTARGWKPASARFKERMTGDNVNVLIDHILASAGLPVAGAAAHKIWNPYEDDDARAFKGDLLDASDHFPITLDLDI